MTQDNQCDAIRLLIDDLTQDQLISMQIPIHITHHVRTCTACKSHLDQQISLSDHVALWTIPEPKRSIGMGVMTQIAQLEHNNSAETASAWACLRLLRVRIQIPASIAALILCLLSVSVALNIANHRNPNGVVQQVSKSYLSPAPENSQVVQQNGSEPRIITTQQDLNTITPWLSQSQIPASTMVIILGAPPLPWTDTVSQTIQSPRHSL